MGQYDIMEFINSSDNKYTCKELCKEFNITMSSMSRLLTVCYKNGFIKREMKQEGFPFEYKYSAKV